ncbi:unnamed protein product [Fusarium graminearum]|nr:unnamed protein product [Fusarium graminearum]
MVRFDLFNEILSTIKRTLPSARRARRDSFGSQTSQDSQRSQDIPARHVDPKKLAQCLSTKFNPDEVAVDLIHNNYNIRAPRRLTKQEIEDCR